MEDMSNLEWFVSFNEPFCVDFGRPGKGGFRNRIEFHKEVDVFEGFIAFELSLVDNSTLVLCSHWNGGDYSFRETLIGTRKKNTDKWDFSFVKSSSCELLDDKVQKLTLEQADAWFQSQAKPILENIKIDIVRCRLLEKIEKASVKDLLSLAGRFSIPIWE